MTEIYELEKVLSLMNCSSAEWQLGELTTPAWHCISQESIPSAGLVRDSEDSGVKGN